MIDTEFVAYNHHSGDTHMLAPAAGRILLALQSAPTDTVTLATSLASLWQLDFNPELMTRTEEVLVQLQSLGLIEAVASRP